MDRSLFTVDILSPQSIYDHETMSALIPSNFTTDSLWADLGGTYEQKSFDRKIQALTHPTGYADERKAELKKIQTASESAFKTSYDGFLAAGLSPDAAKAAAFQSAQAEFANQMRVFNLMFNQGTDAVYQTRAGRKGAGNCRSMLGGDPATLAPATRALAKHRRRRK